MQRARPCIAAARAASQQTYAAGVEAWAYCNDGSARLASHFIEGMARSPDPLLSLSIATCIHEYSNFAVAIQNDDEVSFAIIIQIGRDAMLRRRAQR